MAGREGSGEAEDFVAVKPLASVYYEEAMGLRCEFVLHGHQLRRGKGKGMMMSVAHHLEGHKKGQPLRRYDHTALGRAFIEATPIRPYHWQLAIYGRPLSSQTELSGLRSNMNMQIRRITWVLSCWGGAFDIN